MIECASELSSLEDLVSRLEASRLDLATYFCEDEAKFRLEDCLQVFYKLCSKVKDATQVMDVFKKHVSFTLPSCNIFIINFLAF